MALVLADRVQETTTTSGTGTLTLNGAVPGFQDFATGIGSGNTTYYTIYDPTTYEWEVGTGTFTSSGTDTLSRDTVLSNSLGTTAKINLAGNQTNVFVTYPSEKSVNLNAAGVAEIGEPISYADTGLIATFASTVAGYNQVIVQNKSTATNASANLNVSNDASGPANGFAELGINSSTFSNGPGCFNIPNAAYVASSGADLSIGTYNAYDIHFATNSSTTDAMTIFDNGGTSLGGYGNPGIGNLALNKVVSGISIITSAGGTTVLNAASTYYQRVTGTTTQTIQLPDATTLLNGTTFIVDNDSTGNVTVTDFATASLDVLPSGGLSYLYLVDNSTVAGTWTAHGYLPSIYNFNNTVADFGNASITNAVWNGTTIAYNYGGTGLTSFGAANNALYSTSASTLTAGTLPIAAGGTGQTTANSALNALLPSQSSNNGKYLTTNGTDTSWATVTQTTFSAGTTGFTPSSPTSGAVTLAGTLNVANGGTGLTSLTTNYIPYGNGTSPYQSSATFTYNGTTLTASNYSTGGNLTFTGTANRITGDFSNATFADRASFQSSTTNGTTRICVLPNGTATSTSFNFFNNSDPTNSGRAVIGIESTKCYVQASISGTGTYLPLTLETSGSERMRIDTSGNVGIGTSSPTTYGGAKVAIAGGQPQFAVAGGSSTAAQISLLPNNQTSTTSNGAIIGQGYNTGTDNIVYVSNQANADMLFRTNATERMRITSNGGVSFGSSGTAYGTAGQVLQSNGDAPPTWVTPASGGVSSITGTSNQVIASASTGAVTLSLPQSIDTGASVQFGSFGVGTAASGTTGEIRATNNITAYFSDDRFKINLGNIPNALDKVQMLNGFYYEVNELAQSYGYEVKREVGVSAQQVQAVMPEVVAPAPIDEKYLTVRYERLVPLLIEAIKELKAEIDELKKAK